MSTKTEKDNIDVLIIDDDQFTISLALRHARKSGLSMKAFETPEDLLIGLETHNARALIVDQRMPAISGDALLAELVGRQLTGDASLFLCTSAYPSDEVCHRLEALGVSIMKKEVVFSKGGLSLLLEQTAAQ